MIHLAFLCGSKFVKEIRIEFNQISCRVPVLTRTNGRIYSGPSSKLYRSVSTAAEWNWIVARAVNITFLKRVYTNCQGSEPFTCTARSLFIYNGPLKHHHITTKVAGLTHESVCARERFLRKFVKRTYIYKRQLTSINFSYSSSNVLPLKYFCGANVSGK